MGLKQNTIIYKAESFEHYFLCYYQPLHVGKDRLSKSLIRFKNHIAVDVQAWIECSVEHLAPLFQDHSITIVRALGSQERYILNDNKQNPLDALGNRLSSHLVCSYKPESLVKKHIHTPLKFLSLPQRKREISELYEYNSPLPPASTILVIDDIMTTGTTLCAIIHAIRKKFDNRIILYTLANSDRGLNANSAMKLVTPHYKWEPTSGWLVHEPILPNWDINRLKAMIECNFME